MDPTRTVTLPDLAATEALAARLAPLAQAGDAVLLEGPLGAGKSAFARAFLRRLAGDPGLEVPSPSFKIILDVKAMSSESKPIPAIIRDSWPHFAHFHANDTNLKGPGFGDVDFKPIAAALKEVGYSGYVSVEVFKFEEGAEVIAAKSIDYLRRIFA